MVFDPSTLMLIMSINSNFIHIYRKIWQLKTPKKFCKILLMGKHHDLARVAEDMLPNRMVNWLHSPKNQKGPALDCNQVFELIQHIEWNSKCQSSVVISL